MSKELINFNTKITIFLSFLILNSFVILFLKLPTNLLKLNIIGFLTVFFIFYLKFYKSNFSLKLYFFFNTCNLYWKSCHKLGFKKYILVSCEENFF